MISIREMTAADEGAVMEMVDRFYHSPAVEHEVDPAVLRRSFQAAVDPAEPLIQGLVLEEDGRPVGYHYMCIGYSAEVGGRYLLLDELYLAPDCRGKGYGEQVIRWAMEQHPECARYRLESLGRTGPPGCTSGWASAIWTTSRWSLTGKKECLV